jgi:hypothetical protein
LPILLPLRVAGAAFFHSCGTGMRGLERRRGLCRKEPAEWVNRRRAALLIIRFKASGSWHRAPVAKAANGRIRPGFAVVNGQPVQADQFVYQVRYYENRKLKYRNAGKNASEAETLRRRIETRTTAKADAIQAGLKVEADEDRRTISGSAAAYIRDAEQPNCRTVPRVSGGAWSCPPAGVRSESGCARERFPSADPSGSADSGRRSFRLQPYLNNYSTISSPPARVQSPPLRSSNLDTGQLLANPKDIAICVQGQFMRGAAKILTQTPRLESKANNQQIGP